MKPLDTQSLIFWDFSHPLTLFAFHDPILLDLVNFVVVSNLVASAQGALPPQALGDTCYQNSQRGDDGPDGGGQEDG